MALESPAIYIYQLYGTFPEADYFEMGNGVSQSAGSKVSVVDNNIITGYNGEFWKNSQTNYYNHYYEDGLAVGQFGTDRYTNLVTAATGTPAMPKHQWLLRMQMAIFTCIMEMSPAWRCPQMENNQS